MLPTIQIIYASASGNVEVVAERVYQQLLSAGFASQIQRAELTKSATILQNNLFIFATSTWEHGAINPYFNEILDVIRGNFMSNKAAAFVGLGDTRYEPVFFCEGIEILKNAFMGSGGKPIGSTLKINGDPYALLDSTVLDWGNQFIANLNKYVQK